MCVRPRARDLMQNYVLNSTVRFKRPTNRFFGSNCFETTVESTTHRSAHLHREAGEIIAIFVTIVSRIRKSSK